MGKWWVWVAVVALLGSAFPALAERSLLPETAGKPNIIFILTDDLDTNDLWKFPNISSLLMRQGTTFSRFFVANPWCCPSRSSILRSQYVHSHGVTSNRNPTGGFPKFHAMEGSTLGTWMQDAGYRTALMGKYLNQYPDGVYPTYIPPGWDEWVVPVTHLYQEYGYLLNDNGRLAGHGYAPEDYLTDVLARKAVDFAAQDDPFFLYLSPVAPHRPANYAPRHEKAFPGARAPRTPAFDQHDVSAEPAWLRKRKPLSESAIDSIDSQYRDRLRAMLGVDDLVGDLVTELTRTGKLADTYLFLTSDNGFHLGQHRLRPGKTTPFEEDIRVPMIVRGPGVAAGRSTDVLGSSVDFGPTFAELAGARLPGFCEGRSLVPVLHNRPVSWRDAVLVEFVRPDYATGSPPTYRMLRTARHSYVEYETGESQLYDLAADPNQLHNLVAGADPALIAHLSSRLAALQWCQGAGCRVADAALPEAS
ncbi:sulfatase [Acrocarpospora pleiomorpha]|uniref:Sulfatase n=1 Tax=Acrocarpospora pleiomorpha TaxID=90975 RepID=A0A5M3XJ22_9ACTN|nr:sulfatase [Acrocarpospora pleiomorpha]GES21475.1 sulfatase [Acrocarpospora pleiomorpha]